MGHSDRKPGAKAPRRRGKAGRTAKRTSGRADERTPRADHPARQPRQAAATAPPPGDAAPRVLVTRAGGIATLTLDRPEKRNALDRRAVSELKAALAACDLARDVRLVVLRGAGKDFCAGGDLAETLASVDAPVEENERSAFEIGELFLQLRALPRLTVAVVQGRALAGGAGLALACDFVVARDDAELGFPEILRGFVPGMVTALLRRMVGEKVAFDLAATGRPVGAREAERLGLVSRVVSARGFESQVTKLLASLAALPPSAMALLKQEFHRLDGMGFEQGVRLGARVNAIARTTPDFRQGVAAFLEK
jgi:methylglutaconyl-CoA hydratase